jgi:3-methylcrotonyl-CoA carboxylase alpha subunit
LSQAQQAQAKAAKTNDPFSPWNMTNAWRLNEANIHHMVLAHNGTEYPIIVEQKRQGSGSYYLISVDGQTVDCQGRIENETLYASIDGYRSHATIAKNANQISLFHQHGVFNFIHIVPDCGDNSTDDNHGGLVAPMNGTMVSVLIKSGDNVIANQPLMIMEAMKMEHTIRAPSNGVVDAVYYKNGDMVDGGAELIAFTAEEA